MQLHALTVMGDAGLRLKVCFHEALFGCTISAARMRCVIPKICLYTRLSIHRTAAGEKNRYGVARASFLIILLPAGQA